MVDPGTFQNSSPAISVGPSRAALIPYFPYFEL